MTLEVIEVRDSAKIRGLLDATEQRMDELKAEQLKLADKIGEEWPTKDSPAVKRYAEIAALLAGGESRRRALKRELADAERRELLTAFDQAFTALATEYSEVYSLDQQIEAARRNLQDLKDKRDARMEAVRAADNRSNKLLSQCMDLEIEPDVLDKLRQKHHVPGYV